jgi:hypothetical protein
MPLTCLPNKFQLACNPLDIYISKQRHPNPRKAEDPIPEKPYPTNLKNLNRNPKNPILEKISPVP